MNFDKKLEDFFKDSNPHSATDKPYTTKIKRIVENTPKIKSFFFDYFPNGFPVNILPGQFLMIWIPGVDEVPMSVSYIGKTGELGITVQNVGEATNALHSLNVGDYIGIRGPYGTSYIYDGKFSIVIGGGVGLASLRELIIGINHHEPHKLVLIMGAKTKNELLFIKEMESLVEDTRITVCTDDGSYCNEGFTTKYFEKDLPKIIAKIGDPSKIVVYTCGPEKMMKKVFDICEKNGIEVQASLERMMRCGFGLCGLCVLDPLGIKVCQNGPVFTSDILRKTDDFGNYIRDFSGEKIKE